MTNKLEITINQTWIPFPPYFPKLDELKKKKKFFFFERVLSLWYPLLIITLYHQTKTLINFLCRQELNPRSLIQSLEILPVELPWNPKKKKKKSFEWIESFPNPLKFFPFSFLKKLKKKGRIKSVSLFS